MGCGSGCRESQDPSPGKPSQMAVEIEPDGGTFQPRAHVSPVGRKGRAKLATWPPSSSKADGNPIPGDGCSPMQIDEGPTEDSSPTGSQPASVHQDMAHKVGHG